MPTPILLSEAAPEMTPLISTMLLVPVTLIRRSETEPRFTLPLSFKLLVAVGPAPKMASATAEPVTLPAGPTRLPAKSMLFVILNGCSRLPIPVELGWSVPPLKWSGPEPSAPELPI